MIIKRGPKKKKNRADTFITDLRNSAKKKNFEKNAWDILKLIRLYRKLTIVRQKQSFR